MKGKALDVEKKGPNNEKRNKMLGASFILMIVIGLGNKIFQKLQTLPMYVVFVLNY